MTSQLPSIPPAPPGYRGAGAPPPGAGYASGAAPKTSGLAIASLVTGLAGFCIPIVGGIVGIILAVVALRQIGRSGGAVGGKGLAIGGLVVSVVTLLFGLVLGVVMVAFGLYAGRQASIMQGEFRNYEVREALAMTAHALDVYELDLGHYPTEAEGGLRALRENPPGVDGWCGPYLNDEPTDTWGNPIRYEPPDPSRPDDLAGHTYRIWSAGPDGIDGTPDDVER